ncbi:putative thyroid hormone receptor binding protein [Lyophyllum shimeji]|uniref:Thyroid hormone receptor binding protein n=1 Tax=Lyophyllum shimeji TaxID=47721 RepID=A0A9P3PCR2_LYOSH|nr:putative thyroid hormone receptor binding protein [Lyophyllum shimeji]
MASHSPQRARRPPVHPVPQGSMHNLRETSRSPSLRARTGKTHSMPIVPTAMQIFNAAQPSSQTQQQPSPTSSINSRRSPPTGVTVQRLLPTPPHPPPNVQDANQDRHVSPPLPPQHAHNAPNPHYPRPVHRGPPPQFLAKYQNMEQESWEMTEELLAEIERADMQHAQAQSNSANAYPAGYPQNQQNNASPKDPAVERVRAMERSSPKDLVNIQQEQRRQQAARESPKARERPQPNSPTTASFSQPPSQTPEHQTPPYQGSLGASGESPASGYMQYTREPPPTIRRASNPLTTDSRQPIPSLATQTPPLQAITARTPDRSLPVQEEVEDEPGVASKNGTGARDAWQDTDDAPQHVRPTGSSPTPSSDLNPEGAFNDDHAGDDGSTRPGHRDDKSASVQHEDSQHRYSDRDRDHLEDEGGYTPRSPTAELPEHPPAKYYQAQNTNARPPQPQPARRHARNGSTDQLGLRTLDPSVFEGDQSVLVMGSEQLPPQYAEQRRQTQPPPQSQQYHNAQQYSQAQYHSSQMQPDNMEQYDSSYLQSYLHSPRPDAPIPPTPHSQTAAPSPSPLLSGNYGVGGKDLPPFSPVAPVGSPYPYPFTHVRRTQTFSGPHPNRPQVPGAFNAAELSTIQQQMIKQWQVYAQNHHAGNVTDSTLSPSSTPFPGGGAYNPWAFLHTKRTLGIQDTLSLRSSPSHEPVALPTPPPMIGVKKSMRPAVLRRRMSSRKPPPRVESTQPRETSPEPSSSGEETAGEERFVPPADAEEGSWANGGANGPVVVVGAADENDEWIDEDDDDDDLLELEYHPNYVGNVEKRRRRWEIGWEAVTQALQSLDRQTDATIVVMAAPSHSTKLYSATSRAVRRQSATTACAVSLKEMRSAFSRIALHRRSTRSHKSSLIDRFLVGPSAASGSGSDGSSESREEDLKRALEAALGSLGALGGIYEQREARWHEEMRRVQEDRERVELLLRQVLGDNHSISASSPAVSHASQ